MRSTAAKLICDCNKLTLPQAHATLRGSIAPVGRLQEISEIATPPLACSQLTVTSGARVKGGFAGEHFNP